MIPEYKKKSNTAAAVCLGVLAVAVVLALVNDGSAFSNESGLLHVVLVFANLIFVVSFFVALWFYIRAKGQSGWWILMLVFNLIGLLVIALLRDEAKAVPASEVKSPGQV